MIVLCWTIDAWQSGVFRFSKNPIQLALVGLILIGVIQLLPFGTANETGGVASSIKSLSFDPNATKTTVVFILSMLVYFSASLAFIDTPKRMRIIVYTIIIFGFALAFIGIIQSLISHDKIYGLLDARLGAPFGPFVNRHNFAAYMEMTLGLSLGLLFTGAIDKDKRLLFFTAIGLMGVSLLMSQSRGGLISFIASLAFLIALTSFRQDEKGREVKADSRAILLRVGLAFAFVIVLFIGIASIGSDTSLTRLTEQTQANDPTPSRTEIWQTTLKMIAARPVFGWGLGAYGIGYAQFDVRNGATRAEQAHNDYLQVLADTGIIGAIIGIFFIASLFYQSWQRRKTKDTFRKGVVAGSLTGCFAVLVHSLFDFTLHTTAVALLFLTLAALATIGNRVENLNAYRQHHRRRRASVSEFKRKSEGEVELLES